MLRASIFQMLLVFLICGITASGSEKGCTLVLEADCSFSLRLHTMTENGSAVTGYHYDLAGNVTRKVLPNGTETRSTFDALGRKLGEVTRTDDGAGTIISAFDYAQPQGSFPSGYDNVGNLLAITETYGSAGINNRTVTNDYDHAYRLTQETIIETGASTTVTGYGYDKANNRVAKTVAVNDGTPLVWNYEFGNLADGYNSNQLKSATDGTTTITFAYDANGSRISKLVGGVTVQTYAYDIENRLISLIDSVKGTFHYTYDHRTRRVGRDEQGGAGVPPASSEVSFAGGLSVQEYITGSGTPNVELIRGSDYGGGIGGVLYTIRGTARSYNAYNSRGDVVSQTSESASITWQAAYEAFGTRTNEQGTTDDRQKANTKDEDPTGLLNEGMRYRDLEFGIFITRDPAGFVDGPNVYTYVAQNPWTAFDPEGLFMQIVGNWLGKHWQAPQAVRSMANHTGTVVNVTQGTLAVASMVPVAGKIADGLSAGISAAEGNYGEAALTAGGGSAGKLLARAKGIMNVADAGADVSKIIREGGEQIQKNGDGLAGASAKATKEASDAAVSKYRGGSHRDMTRTKNDGLDSHHMPDRQADLNVHSNDGPSIQMDQVDHWKTSSNNRSGRGAARYKKETFDMIQNGKYRDAMAREISST
jgi:RHS repeat-associated protein